MKYSTYGKINRALKTSLHESQCDPIVIAPLSTPSVRYQYIQ